MYVCMQDVVCTCMHAINELLTSQGGNAVPILPSCSVNNSHIARLVRPFIGLNHGNDHVTCDKGKSKLLSNSVAICHLTTGIYLLTYAVHKDTCVACQN